MSNAARSIRDVPISHLNIYDSPLDISSTGIPCKIRLVDCQALTEKKFLRIVEFSDFPSISYSTISYPWRGVGVDPTSVGSIFAVKGAEHADPVGVDALRHACVASLIRGNPYLWLDRLCIIQDNREDKDWQIRHMYKVYKSCRLCIILAGGVQRLVRLDEETSWIHRSWTLQEVLAPPEAVVLLDWKLGPGFSLSEGKVKFIQEVVSGESAIATLSLILGACTVRFLSFTPSSASDQTTKPLLVEASIFSAHPFEHSIDTIPFWSIQRNIFAPNVIALSIAMDDVLSSDVDTRNHAVWQSALMRTSSRPVDMVFSIMGLFNVELNPAAFHENDRRGATLALAQEILKSGGRASWLGIGFHLERDRGLSTFPIFPRTNVSGVAFVHTQGKVQEISELLDPMYPISEALVPLPTGQMDDAGYLTFRTKATRLISTSQSRKVDQSLKAIDGSSWEILDYDGLETELASSPTSTQDSSPAVYAALLGWFNKYYPGVTPAHGSIQVMLLEEHSMGKYHLRSFFTLDQSKRQSVLRWPEREFCVGGPEPFEAVPTLETPEETVQTYVERGQPWPLFPWNKSIPIVQDEAIKMARWAVPQRILERYHNSDRNEQVDH